MIRKQINLGARVSHLNARPEVILLGHFLRFNRRDFSPSAQFLLRLVQIKYCYWIQLGFEHQACQIFNVVLPAGKSTHFNAFTNIEIQFTFDRSLR